MPGPAFDHLERPHTRHVPLLKRIAASGPATPEGLRALEAGRSHDRADLPVRGLAGDGPKGPVRASHARLEASEAVHELKGYQVLRNRNGPPLVGPALQGRNPDLARLEVHVARADPERLGHPAPGHRERSGKRLDRGLGARARRGEEALALLGGEVLPAPGVDQGEGAVGHGSEKLHYFMSNDQRRARPPSSAALLRAIPARPAHRGVPKRDRMCIREHEPLSVAFGLCLLDGRVYDPEATGEGGRNVQC